MVIERRIYPALLVIYIITSLIAMQIMQFARLYEHIKNDKYLVGKRLVNYYHSQQSRSSETAFIFQSRRQPTPNNNNNNNNDNNNNDDDNHHPPPPPPLLHPEDNTEDNGQQPLPMDDDEAELVDLIR